MTKKYFSEIYGCQMNVSDSQELEESLNLVGWSKTDTSEDADAVIINSCAIRQTAEDRVLAHLGFYKNLKTKKDFILVFMGCVAQKQKEQIIKKYPFVDYVIGPKNRHLIPELLEKHQLYTKQAFKKNVDERVLTSLDLDASEFLSPVPDPQYPFRSYVTIINGCSKFCTYCIVPYTRGLEKSIPSAKLLSQVENLVKQGVKEIYLLGQNVNSYGLDSQDISFAQLLRAVSLVQGVERIKFISSHPRDFSDELIEELATNSKVSKSLHLALQSGSDDILRKMNRQHTIEHYIHNIEKLRVKNPDFQFSTDIIVGFPFEGKQDFKATLDAMSKIRFSHSFNYMYSQREGTAASNLNDSVSPEEKKIRVQELIDLQNQITKEILHDMLGKQFTVLVESTGSKPHQWRGFTEYEIRAVFDDPSQGQKNLVGKMVLVEAEEILGLTLYTKYIKILDEV